LDRFTVPQQRGLTIGALIAILVLAFGLRVVGISNGLPYSQLTDESSDIAEPLRLASGQMPAYAFHRVFWPISLLPVHAAYFGYLKQFKLAQTHQE